MFDKMLCEVRVWRVRSFRSGCWIMRVCVSHSVGVFVGGADGNGRFVN